MSSLEFEYATNVSSKELHEKNSTEINNDR